MSVFYAAKDNDHHHKYPIRYFKLYNHGAAVIHFLIKDKANGRTVFEGGPTLAAGNEAIIDLSTTPGVVDHTSFCFGAFVTAGSNATDKHHHTVDFSSELVGVWKWTGTTIAKSRVHFEGYEKFKPHDPLRDLILQARVVCDRRGELDPARAREAENAARIASMTLGRLLLEHDLETTVPYRARL